MQRQLKSDIKSIKIFKLYGLLGLKDEDWQQIMIFNSRANPESTQILLSQFLPKTKFFTKHCKSHF